MLAIPMSLFFSPSQPVHALCGADPNFFSIPPWHYYIESCDDTDNIDNSDEGFELNDVWLIFAALFEALLKVSAIFALGYVIWGGFKYIMSQGAPEGTAKARKTLTYALAGLAISVLSSAAVTLVMDIIAGGTDSGTSLLPDADSSDALQRILNFVYAIGGGVAAIYVAIGTVKFATSSGEPAKAAAARNTILYALVGVVVIVGAFMLTTAILGRLSEI